MPRNYTPFAGASEVGEPRCGVCTLVRSAGLCGTRSSSLDRLREVQAVGTARPGADWGPPSSPRLQGPEAQASILPSRAQSRKDMWYYSAI